MNKADFLLALTRKIQNLPQAERIRLIDYYDELIEDYIEEGYTEVDAVRRLGDFNQILKEIGVDHYESNRVKKQMIRLAIILGFPLWGSILLSIWCLLFSVYILIGCWPLIMFALCFSLIVVGIVGVFGGLAIMSVTFFYGLFQLGLGLTFVGLSYYSINGLLYASKIGFSTIKNINSYFVDYVKGIRGYTYE